MRALFAIWMVLGAAAPVRAEEPATFTLPQAVERARRLNPDIRALQARLAQQSAAVRVSLARVLPSLTVTGSWLHNEQQVEAAGRVVARQDELSLVGGLQVGLFRPGALGDWLVAGVELDASREAATYESEAVAFGVVELFIGAQRAGARRAAAQAAVERRAAFQRAAEARLKSELTDRSEAQRAALSLAAATMELDAAAADEAAALVALAAVLDVRGPGVRLAGDGSAPAAASGAPDAVRGDVRAVRMLLDERDELARTFTWLRFLPDLELQTTFAQAQESFTNPDGLTWRLELQARWPLYDGGERYGLLDLAEATGDLHRAELAGLEVRVGAEVRVAELRVEQHERQLATARWSLETAAQVREDVGRRLDAGLATLLDVLDAEAQLSAADERAATLAHDLELARWRLVHVRGELRAALP